MSAREPQADVLAFLADPAVHGLGPGGVVHVRTHISEVFLAGTVAYKVKRAMRFSFVDFTALEDRRAACEAEVALNRRTAPELYLGVVAIRRQDDGSLALDRLDQPGAGTPFEWAVVMRRFDENRTLDRLAARGELGPELVDELVDQVIALHDVAERHSAPYGGARELGDVISGNADDMAKQPDILAPGRAQVVTATARKALARHAELLDARREAGFVRRCHGDLHLANAVLWRDRPVLFDCIEFSERIAVIDVAYDLAFLLMDLEVRGLRSLANRAFGRYFGRAGGTDVLAALPLMLGIRACVRAKVTAMAAAQESGVAARVERAREARDLAGDLLAAAERFLAPPPPVRVIAVGGLSGTGKTSLAGALAPEYGPPPGALHVRSDVIRKRLAGVAPEARLPPESYTARSNRAVYEVMLAEAARALAGGYCVVMDAVFARPSERDSVERLARDAGAAFTGLWLEAPLPTLLARVGARRRDASDATAEVVEGQSRYDIGPLKWKRIDAGRVRASVLAEARTAVGR